MTFEHTAVAVAHETSGYRRVLAHFRDLLVNGRVETGHRLPSERELAQRLGVSRPAVREAVRAMEMIGVLATRHGRASTVRIPDAPVLGDFFSLALAQQPAIIEDIVEVRIALERQALRLACTRATPDDHRDLEQALDEIEVTIADASSGGHADLRFHTLLVAAAHSPALSTVYGTITHLLERSHVERRKRMADSPKAHLSRRSSPQDFRGGPRWRRAHGRRPDAQSFCHWRGLAKCQGGPRVIACRPGSLQRT